MGQVNMVEVKEAAEKGRDGKAEAAEKKRGVNNGFMGILYRNSKPMANPPRTEFSRRKNPDRDEVEKFSFGNNGHVGYLRKATGCWGRLEESPQQTSSRSSSWVPSQFYQRAEQKANGREDSEAERQELGHGKQRRLKAQLLWDILELDTVSKSAQSAPSAPRGHPVVISKEPTRHLITRLSSSKWLARPAITRRCFYDANIAFNRSALPPKC
jgi:hypothetical protein